MVIGISDWILCQRNNGRSSKQERNKINLILDERLKGQNVKNSKIEGSQSQEETIA